MATPRRLMEQVAALASGAISAGALVEESLQRIAQGNDAVGAFVDIDVDGARAQARAADERRAQHASLSPLDGVPVGLKDNLCQEGRPTTAASRILQGWRAPYDATCVRRLREAGCVLVGKTNMDEFGMGSTSERSAFFPTKNPWDHSRSAGGSSGGSAAAVAAGFVGGALGTDTGGSVRQPASFCNVVGIKPTYGRVSRFGVVAFASSLDQVGVFSHDVAGAAMLLSAIAGHDARDATSSTHAAGAYVPADDDVAGLRIGVPRGLWQGLDVQIGDVLAAVQERLQRRGARFVDVDLPHAGHAVACYYVLCTAEASSNLSRYDGVRYGPRRGGESIESVYEQTRALFGDEVKRRILLGSFVLSHGFYEAYVVKAQKVRRTICQDFAAAFVGCDAILLPTAPTPALPLGAAQRDPLELYLGDLFTLPASLAGLPALSVPAGFVQQNGARRLPVGAQLVGAPFDEARLLRIARAIEQDAGVVDVTPAPGSA